MNISKEQPFPSLPNHDSALVEALSLFPLENLQKLDVSSALHCQKMLGHGGAFGIWLTPESMVPHLRKGMRSIDLRRRISSYLPNELSELPALDSLLDEGVLWLTRLALLMRMGPAGLAGKAKLKSLDVTSIASILYDRQTQLVALGINRRLKSTESAKAGFVSGLLAEDLLTLWANEKFYAELKRLMQLHGLNLWSDTPTPRDFKATRTTLRGPPELRSPERKRRPHPPIPDEYLEVMGPRVMWLIKDLGPNLLHLIEALPKMLEYRSQPSVVISLQIKTYFEANVWHDRNGQVIKKPPFELWHTGARGTKEKVVDKSQQAQFEWPPRHWRSVQNLAVTLQSAHLWLVLLVMAARVSEVATLGRDCVEFARDGELYVNGKTYKPSRTLSGKKREWPMPDILVDVLAQQIKLVEASEHLAQMINGSSEKSDSLNNSTHLWASLGTSGSADATVRLALYDQCLRSLAERIGLTPKPGGKNLHPHRFRTTLARLAGLAIDGSQKVLMLLLGHENVTTTLGYMQADPAFASEVNDITRELRIMRGEALIEDMRAALQNPSSLPFGGHGGGGAPVLADSVSAYEEELHRNGEEWGGSTARELSVLLTNNGESARLISAHIVCTKTAGEIGLCSNKKGAIVAGNCQPECRNHIEDKTGRRDTERVIPILVKHAQENIANNDWLPLARDKKQLDQELRRYDDIGAKWRAKPEVQAILGIDT